MPMREGDLSVTERLAAAAAWLGLAIFYLRTLGKPSLWLDEAWEANYYVGHVAAPWMNRPVLYMAAQKLMAAAAGPSEFALRLLPCLAALVAVAALWILARRRVGGPEAWTGAAILALAPPFLFQAHQLKHYPFDALATTLVLAAYARWRDRRSTRRAVEYAALGAACVTVSFPVPLVLVGLAVVEIASAPRDRGALLRFAAASAVVAAVFVPVYLVFHAGDAREGLLKEYWAAGFLPWHAPGTIPRWIAEATLSILKDHTGAASGVAASGLILAGALGVPPRARYLFGALASVLAAHLLAGAFHAYPYGPARLSLYAAPLVALAAGCGLACLVRPGPVRAARIAATAALAYAAFHGTLSGAAPYLSTGWRGEDIRELVLAIHRERRPGDAICVHEDTAPAFSFYWRRLGHVPPFPDVIFAPGRREEPSRHAEEVARLAAKYERVWGLYTHAPRDEIRALRLAFRERYDAAEERFVPPDAWLDLWQRRRDEARPGGRLDTPTTMPRP
jgi:hypothetical protein